MYMTYIPNTDAERAEMLKIIGVNSFEDLISNIPASLRLKGDLKISDAFSEYEVLKHMRDLSNKNETVTEFASYLGGGAYDHFIPAIVDHVISRPEFYTAYTPYQAELSQGTLQVMYEFQSCVSMLSGLDIANASLYDGGSAIAEAAIMAMNISRKDKILVASTLHDHYKEVLTTYLSGISVTYDEIAEDDGTISLADLKSKLSDDVAAVIVQHPNFFGNLEQVDEINKLVKEFPKVQFIVSFNPITVGILKSPGDYGADIAIAEGQPLGVPLSFGGPYIGLFATKDANIRKMPGRMAGKTLDSKGKEGFVLALQTREQHIKREKATSNICTNQGLITLAVLTYLTYIGKEGLVEVAKQCYNKAHYLAEEIEKIPGFELKYKKEFFNEFAINCEKNVDDILAKLHDQKIMGGLNLKKFGNTGLLIAVTEKRSKAELDNYVEVLKSL
ncbi:MAG: aminomethyl-transferring glycine dehydrogenase subunit GcvPA [Bacteroidetes bacterium]|nr:aminomethyl-transferring glycine dehydrogenase subunit GcvPA [Bacteroidota bacterium]